MCNASDNFSNNTKAIWAETTPGSGDAEPALQTVTTRPSLAIVMGHECSR
jgi:hypothetical protein